MKRGGSVFAAAFDQPDDMTGDDHHNQERAKEIDFLTFEQGSDQREECRLGIPENQNIEPCFISRMGKVYGLFPFFRNGDAADGDINAALLEAFQFVANALADDILVLSVQVAGHKLPQIDRHSTGFAGGQNNERRKRADTDF